MLSSEKNTSSAREFPVLSGDLTRFASPTPDPPSLDTAWLQVMERLQCGAFLLDAHQRVVEWNDIGLALLIRWSGSTRTLSSSPKTEHITTALRRLLSLTTKASEKSWRLVQNEDEPAVVACTFRLRAAEGTCCLLFDLAEAFHPDPSNLKKLFGLTSTEARLALEIARGASPAALADRMMVRQTTIRSHLAALFAKTGTRRQSELVALLARVSLLP
jgi:DNA-binding CsgD family transcriptional regulator